MRILKKKIISKNASGFIKIQADEMEDIYHLYNLISEGDLVEADTTRNVVKESNSGVTTKKRMAMRLKIRVERVEFDIQQCSLRLNGRNVEESEHVKMGQYHTLEVEIGHPLSIEKDCWDSIHLQSVDDASDVSKRAEIAAIVMQDGLANICLITKSMTITKLKIEKTVPKKRQGGDEYDKAKIRFFNDIFIGIQKHIDFDIVKVVLIGSPGFLKDDFMAYFHEECVRREEVNLGKMKTRFVKAHTSCGYRRAIDEMLIDPALQSQLGDVKAASEVKALQQFHNTLNVDPDRACYGPKEILYADTQLAIDQLLITDSLFKAADPKIRQNYVALVDSVKDHGGKVFIFSSLHASGEQLTLYTGIAATLRFPLVMPDDDEDIELEETERTIESLSLNSNT